MPITKTKHIPPSGLGKFPILLYGESGTGKTTLALQFEKPYFLCCEANNEYEMYRDNVTDFSQIIEKLNDFNSGNHDFKTLVIENVYIFWRMAEEYVLNEYNNSADKKQKKCLTLSDIPFAKGFTVVDALINSVLLPLITNGIYNLIFITHTEVEQFTNLSQETFNKFVPRVKGKRAKEFFDSQMSNVFYYFSYKDKRYLRIVGDDFVEAKNRGKNYFKTTKGEQIINIPMGNNEEEAYKYLQAAYNNKLQNTYKNIGVL